MPRKNEKKLTLTVTITGATDGDIEYAISEVNRLVGEGYTSGHSRNDTGSYQFDVAEAA